LRRWTSHSLRFEGTGCLYLQGVKVYVPQALLDEGNVTFKKPGVFFLLLFFGILQLMLPEAPQPYDLLYYPRIGQSNILHQFRAAIPP
jgi:hypothetical protein